MDSVAMTAQWMAAERARETARPDRLFDDPLAEVLAGPEGAELLARMEAGRPASTVVPIRTRFFDGFLTRLVKEHRIAQIVLLAAGMDARAFRMDLPAQLTVSEVDRPAVLALKEARLGETRVSPRCRRQVVGADLTGAWADDLADAGFSPERPAIFLAEGLLAYLDEGQVHGLLGNVGGLSAPGSFLLADVGGRSLLDAPYMASWLAAMAEGGMAWRFGTDDPESLFSAEEWDPQVTQYGDEGANFGRWPWPPVDRHDLRWPHSSPTSSPASRRRS